MNNIDTMNRIKSRRREIKLTQAQLAQKVGRSLMTIVRWEKGERNPDIAIMPKLAEALNTSVEYLMGLDKHSEPQNLHTQKLQHPDNSDVDLLTTGGITDDKLIIDDKKAHRVYYLPNNEEGRKLFLYVMANGFNGVEPPLVSNTINGNNNTDVKQGVINN